MFESIHRKVLQTSDLRRIREDNRGKRIVVCSGCYDLMHVGHAVFFSQCKEFGDILVVSVGTDAVLRKLKGSERPVLSEENRVHLVAALAEVDYAVLGSQEVGDDKIDFRENLQSLRPDVFVLNSDDSSQGPKRQLCEELDIELKLVDRILPPELTPTSTTEIIEKVKSL